MRWWSFRRPISYYFFLEEEYISIQNFVTFCKRFRCLPSFDQKEIILAMFNTQKFLLYEKEEKARQTVISNPSTWFKSFSWYRSKIAIMYFFLKWNKREYRKIIGRFIYLDYYWNSWWINHLSNIGPHVISSRHCKTLKNQNFKTK